jgi:hypothetical protein
MHLAPVADLSPLTSLLTTLVDGGGQSANQACEVLGSMQPAPVEAVDSLRCALADDGLVIRAASALWKIERRADLILPSLERVFYSTTTAKRHATWSASWGRRRFPSCPS